MILEELKGEKELTSQCFCKEMEPLPHQKTPKILFFEGGCCNYSRILAFPGKSWNLILAKPAH